MIWGQGQNWDYPGKSGMVGRSAPIKMANKYISVDRL